MRRDRVPRRCRATVRHRAATADSRGARLRACAVPAAAEIVLGMDLEPRHRRVRLAARARGAGSAARSPPQRESGRPAPRCQWTRTTTSLTSPASVPPAILVQCAGRNQYERLRIAGRGGLTGAGMGTGRAVILAGGVDAVALLEFFLHRHRLGFRRHRQRGPEPTWPAPGPPRRTAWKRPLRIDS